MAASSWAVLGRVGRGNAGSGLGWLGQGELKGVSGRRLEEYPQRLEEACETLSFISCLKKVLV